MVDHFWIVHDVQRQFHFHRNFVRNICYWFCNYCDCHRSHYRHLRQQCVLAKMFRQSSSHHWNGHIQTKRKKNETKKRKTKKENQQKERNENDNDLMTNDVRSVEIDGQKEEKPKKCWRKENSSKRIDRGESVVQFTLCSVLSEFFWCFEGGELLLLCGSNCVCTLRHLRRRPTMMQQHSIHSMRANEMIVLRRDVSDCSVNKCLLCSICCCCRRGNR